MEKAAMYAVFGNPVAHSRSPEIHQAFAAQRHQPMDYQRLLSTPETFADDVRRFFASGGRGANVTVPFKEDAHNLCHTLSDRARQAQAVNTLWMEGEHLCGDNTDGTGLVTDLRDNLGWAIKGCRILILGAGGAVRGVLAPLLAEKPDHIVIANRTQAKAENLVTRFDTQGCLSACGLDALAQQPLPDLIINATSAGLSNQMFDLPAAFANQRIRAYDMIYGDTPFLQWASRAGMEHADGLGMLVEQAAAAFAHWHGWHPETAPVIRQLRNS